ncbi:MAG: glucosyl hydrolase family protein [Myxococcaceae bacterium]|nr:glucosyl hydrolase family protein [Myxococcaceae bacterium]
MKRAACLLLLLTGCLKTVPQQKAATLTPLTVGWALEGDHSAELVPAPEKLKAQVSEALIVRNLALTDAGALSGVRFTAQRLEALRAADPAGWVLLIEARATFFSQLEGRFRWTVSVKLTASSKPGELVEDTFSVPALLQFEHEREPQALAAVAGSIAQRAGTLLDGLLLAVPPVATGAARSGPDGLVYFVMVDRFANGDPTNDGVVDLKDPAAFHGGDLQGVLNRLDWLQSLGVRTVWLSPVFAMRPDKYGPYGAFHGYWTWDLNRVDPRFGDEALLGKLSDALHARGMRLVMDLVLNHVGPDAPLVKEKPSWFHQKGGITDWNDPDQLVNSDVHGLPDLATEREDVYRFLLDASLKWIRVARPDGFRLDAVKHLPLSFWARFNQDLRKASRPNFELLGEMLDGDPQVVSRVQREGGFTTMFDFPLHFAIIDVFCKGQSAARLAAVLTSDRVYPSPGTLTTLADNHDLPRLMSQCGNDLEKARQAIAFLLTARGVPSIIWGTEIGQVGEKDPANRASMIFAEAPMKAEIAKWTALRRQSPALESGATRVIEASRDAFAALRLLDDQAALVVFNRADTEWKAPPLEGKWTEPLVVAPKSEKVFLGTGSFKALAANARALSQGKAVTREVRFIAKGAGKEDDVRVVGSGPELGGWRPEAGLKLTGAVGTARLPVDGVFEFKLAVKSGAGPWRWQSGDNQVLQVGAGAAQQVELQWREG